MAWPLQAEVDWQTEEGQQGLDQRSRKTAGSVSHKPSLSNLLQNIISLLTHSTLPSVNWLLVLQPVMFFPLQQQRNSMAAIHCNAGVRNSIVHLCLQQIHQTTCTKDVPIPHSPLSYPATLCCHVTL